MINVLLSSLCTGQAADTTRRILDQFGTRCGPRAWSAQLTAEGLSSLRSVLLAQAVRQTAVSCVCVDENGTTLLWMVGRRNKFLGFKSRSLVVTAQSSRRAGILSPPAKAALASAVNYSAIRHDLGKANRFMARKLRSDLHEPDPIRHEILSCFVAGRMEHGQENFVERFNQAGAAARLLSATTEFFPLPTTQHDVAMWVVATHHRLPHASGGSATYANHVHEGPAQDLHAVSECAGDILVDEELRQSLTEPYHGPKSRCALNTPAIEGMFMWTRLALMLGDHMASRQVLCPGVTGILANSANASRPAQDLAKHLLAAKRYGGKAISVLDRLSEILPALHPEDRQELMKSGSGKGGAGFAWQSAAVNTARQITRTERYSETGMFAVLCASTGSGKTRAAVKVMSALSGEKMRLTTLLGLRSLTLQAGDSYAEEAAIPKELLAVLIGSREVRTLHSTDRARKRAEQRADGDLHVEISVENGIGLPLPAIVEGQIGGDDDRRMLCSPVLVCTIDYLMGGADWRKTSHILPHLRLMSSDIILDEIDGYNLEDYPAIGRLCYMIGSFGRKLILSSATAMPEIVAPLYSAYEAGWRSYTEMAGASAHVNCVFIADNVAPRVSRASTERVGKSEAEHFFRPMYQAFTDEVALAAGRTAPLRRGKIAEIASVKEMRNSILSLDIGNSSLSQVAQGVSVSVGLIRVARVADAVALSRALVDIGPEMVQDDSVFIQVVSYHANLPIAVRARIESDLDRLLRRKPGVSDPVAHHEIANRARMAGAKRAIILVVATPVEEVGRDHDFDWAIIEPSSSRSIVQCAGRVNRHRRRKLREAETNIAVMRRNLRDQEGRKRSFWGPGFESKTSPFPSHDIQEIAPSLVDRPDAESCLASAAVDMLPVWERQIIAEVLDAAITKSFSQSLSSKLTDEHFREHGFRSGSSTSDVYFSYQDRLWKSCDTGVPLTFEPAQICPDAHWLFDMSGSLTEIVDETADRVGASTVDEEFCRRYMRIGLAEYYYDNVGVTKTHPLLGIFKEKRDTVLR